MWSRWLTYKHLKDYLDVSVPTLNMWMIEFGFPKPFKSGTNKLYFDKKDVDRWMLKNKKVAQNG